MDVNEKLLNQLLVTELEKINWHGLEKLFREKDWKYVQRDGTSKVPSAAQIRETPIQLFNDCVEYLRTAAPRDVWWTSTGRFLVVVHSTPGCHEVEIYIHAYAAVAQ